MAKKPKPIVRQLENKYGGNWKYIPFHMWMCDDPKLHAHYVAEGGYDINGDYVEPPDFWKKFQPLRVYGTDKDGNNINGHEFYPERK